MTQLRLCPIGAVVLLALLALGSSACASSQALPARGGNFSMALSSDVSTLDPAHAGYDFASWSATVAIYSSLVDYDRGLKITSDLASQWTVSADGKTYT